LITLARRWLPGQPIDSNTLGQALWLEKEHWARMETAIANGIAKAFNG